MAKNRIVNTKFWDDSYVVSLTQFEKLVFLYLLTCPLTNISGVYELPIKRAAFDIGVTEAEVLQAIRKLHGDGKVLYQDGWIAIVNWIKHQSLNPKVRQGILIEILKAPSAIVQEVPLVAVMLGERAAQKVGNKQAYDSSRMRSISEFLPVA